MPVEKHCLSWLTVCFEREGDNNFENTNFEIGWYHYWFLKYAPYKGSDRFPKSSGGLPTFYVHLLRQQSCASKVQT
jgi:hypothetical protein